jgi:type II secretory pathway component PulF
LGLFPPFTLALLQKTFFVSSQQELPAVALLLLQKIAFLQSGLPLLSGAVASFSFRQNINIRKNLKKNELNIENVVYI